ncbi:hypothetical protein IMAU80188_02807 [Lactiplantibacillus plantarum]|nr:hypothetical protein [Lactiplantibacillus plantarum]MCG0619203.1 hypothetical protein [Lactiplantibacillus plantarum]MCG0807633.1 hypothetical protein [Lactiplantibacillus plantarum]MCG0832723.1 hypothetical protein [Lactiplantibacillus plantarum]MCG0851349.1 hypothetical protein [Lactiplantibacillus plantarum]
MFSAVLKNFSKLPTFLPTQLVTPEIPLVTLFKMSPKKPVPFAYLVTPCIAISMAVSLALSTSDPAGNIILVLRPCTMPESPLGSMTISLLPVCGESLPSFNIAIVGRVIGFRDPLNIPVPVANLTWSKG